MEHPQETDLQQQIDDLVALVTKGRTDIDELVSRANDADARATETSDRVTLNRTDIDQLRADVDVDRELIAELQADGAVSREHVDQLQKALASSRAIGSALGILMASRGIDQDAALKVLKEASSRSNTPMRELAAAIVAGPAAARL